MRERAYAEQPVDDLGAHGRALPRDLRAARRRGTGSRLIARVGPARRAERTARAAGHADRPSSCRCATTPACSSTPSIRCRIARTAIASTTMPARCCWPARSTSPASSRCPSVLTARFAAFVQHAWNPDTRRFRNFMSFDRTLARRQRLRRQPRANALGAGRMRAQRRQPVAPALGGRLVRRGLAGRRELSLAARLGLHAARPRRLLRRGPGDDRASRTSGMRLADRLMACLPAVETPDWVWFEEGLSYDNARLPQALIADGHRDADARLCRRRPADRCAG